MDTIVSVFKYEYLGAKLMERRWPTNPADVIAC